MSDDAHPDLIALGERWIAAWNARDLDRILALYADDAEMTSDGIVRARLHCPGLGQGKTEPARLLEQGAGLAPRPALRGERLLHQPEQRRGTLHQRPRANDLRISACRPGGAERRSHCAGISKPPRSCGVAVALRRAAIGSDAVVLEHLLAGGGNLGPVLLQAAQDHHVAGIRNCLAEARDVATARALLGVAGVLGKCGCRRKRADNERQKQNFFQRHVPYLCRQHNVAAHLRVTAYDRRANAVFSRQIRKTRRFSSAVASSTHLRPILVPHRERRSRGHQAGWLHLSHRQLQNPHFVR